jgi:deoxyribonuclease V
VASKARTDDGLTPKEAIALQRVLAARVVREDAIGRPATVAGVDASVRGGRVHAVVAVFSFPRLECIETVRYERAATFPYVPGLLGFREVPALLAAFERLSTRPDLVLVDGHGFAHPRRFGIACHLGVELDLPTIGCGKSLLVGEHREPGSRRGARARLVHRDEVVGYALRTRERVKPLFVSTGHRTSLATAVRLVLACTRGFRLPEPIRAADRAAGEREAGDR